MCPLFEGFPAIVYSGLWVLKVFRKLEKLFPKPIKLVILLTDSPPAFLVNIDKGNYDIELLEDKHNLKDLDDIECDSYLALSTDVLYKGADGIREGLANNEVKVKNFEAISILAKLMGS